MSDELGDAAWDIMRHEAWLASGCGPVAFALDYRPNEFKINHNCAGRLQIVADLQSRITDTYGEVLLRDVSWDVLFPETIQLGLQRIRLVENVDGDVKTGQHTLGVRLELAGVGVVAAYSGEQSFGLGCLSKDPAQNHRKHVKF
jgi:hypothetical protein